MDHLKIQLYTVFKVLPIAFYHINAVWGTIIHVLQSYLPQLYCSFCCAMRKDHFQLWWQHLYCTPAWIAVHWCRHTFKTFFIPLPVSEVYLHLSPPSLSFHIWKVTSHSLTAVARPSTYVWLPSLAALSNIVASAIKLSKSTSKILSNKWSSCNTKWLTGIFRKGKVYRSLPCVDWPSHCMTVSGQMQTF